MNYWRPRNRFIPWFLGSIPVFFALCCSALSALVLSANQERIYDVRSFPRSMTLPDLTGAYLSARVTPETVLFVGSSFSFGYSWASQFAFPSVFATETGRPTVNASTVGASMLGIKQNAICELERRSLRAKAIVIEIPLINEFAHLAKISPSEPKAGLCQSGYPHRLSSYIAMHPNGRQWLAKTRDIYAAYNYDYPDVVILPVPDDYFTRPADAARVMPLFLELLRELVTRSSALAETVYAFVTPVYVPGVKQSGQSPEDVQLLLDLGQRACREELGSNCIDTSPYYSRREVYSNLTHLSIKGNAIFARGMAAAIR